MNCRHLQFFRSLITFAKVNYKIILSCVGRKKDTKNFREYIFNYRTNLNEGNMAYTYLFIVSIIVIEMIAQFGMEYFLDQELFFRLSLVKLFVCTVLPCTSHRSVFIRFLV
ncbi:hypothetical protein PUN28_004235 [Cardiocondyla obscurior]|uniref:Uncharacterized protein n=1 Tax=Cardiocondyla obscurior TaxID=286306 RepID=A0AAW2GQ62_9HYME